MTRRFLAGANKISFLMAGVVAVSLHVLFFAFMHLRDRGTGESGRLRSRDNTAELLQFSSQAAPSSRGQEEGQALPPNLPLPPPPELHSPLNPHRTGQKRPVTSTDANRRPADGPLASRTAGVAQRRGGSRGSGVAGSGPRGVDSSADWAEAKERLRVFLRQEASSSASSPGAMMDAANDTSAETSPAVRLVGDSPLTQAYQALWTQARPYAVPLPMHAVGNTTPAVEVRLASWQEVRAKATPIRHGQMLVFAEKVMLLWLQGDHLYLLQSSRQKDTHS
jgi:hypothetical protein